MIVNKKTRNNRGITLVSLIVTIVVLMIIATVVISGAMDSSILDKAEIATEDFDETQFLERIELIKFNALAEYKVDIPVDSNGNKLSKSKAVAQAIVNEFEGAFEVNNYIRIPNYPKGIVLDNQTNYSIQELDLLDGYRNDQATTSYNLTAIWNKEDKNIIAISHNWYGFAGPQQAYKPFVSSVANSYGSTGAYHAVTGEAIKTLEKGKSYILTLEVINVNTNEATTANDGDFYIGVFTNTNATTMGSKTVKFTELTTGTKIEIPFTNTYLHPQSIVFGASNPNIKWSFDFRVTLEEVEQE